MRNRITQSGSVHSIIIIILVIALLGVLGFVFWQNVIKKDKDAKQTADITNFEQCKAAADSKILETYPEQCVTGGGKSFTATSEQAINTQTKQFVSAQFKLSFNYPSDWLIEVDDSGSSGMDLLSIKDATGEQLAYLYAATNSGGVGGTCDSEQEVDLSVLRTTKLPTVTDTEVDFTYRISPLEVGAAQYIGRMGLVSGPYASVGTTKICPNTIYTMAYVKSFAGINNLMLEFNNGTGFNGKTFSSKQEAIDYMNTDEYKKLEAMITSLDFEQ